MVVIHEMALSRVYDKLFWWSGQREPRERGLMCEGKNFELRGVNSRKGSPSCTWKWNTRGYVQIR